MVIIVLRLSNNVPIQYKRVIIKYNLYSIVFYFIVFYENTLITIMQIKEQNNIKNNRNFIFRKLSSAKIT